LAESEELEARAVAQDVEVLFRSIRAAGDGDGDVKEVERRSTLAFISISGLYTTQRLLGDRQ
jgi:hypothetical protein